MKIAPLFFILACLLSTSIANAEIIIGNGFNCSDSQILKGTKLVSYSKAKSNLAQTMAKLKSKLETAPKKKKAGLKAQLNEAKASKILLKACFEGKLTPDQVDSIFTQLASGSGIYSGTYNGVVNGFLPISGNIQVVFELEGTVFGATLSLGGNLGSVLNAQPLAFQNDVGGISFPATFVLTNTFLGDVTLQVSQNGHLSITNSDQSKPANFEGDFANQSIVCTLNGSYSGYPYTGGATLIRQP